MARHAAAVPPWTCDCPCHTVLVRPAFDVLASMDEWLGNDEYASMEIIEMIIEWREKLAAALGRPPRG